MTIVFFMIIYFCYATFLMYVYNTKKKSPLLDPLYGKLYVGETEKVSFRKPLLLKEFAETIMKSLLGLMLVSFQHVGLVSYFMFVFTHLFLYYIKSFILDYCSNIYASKPKNMLKPLKRMVYHDQIVMLKHEMVVDLVFLALFIMIFFMQGYEENITVVTMVSDTIFIIFFSTLCLSGLFVSLYSAWSVGMKLKVQRQLLKDFEGKGAIPDAIVYSDEEEEVEIEVEEEVEVEVSDSEDKPKEDSAAEVPEINEDNPIGSPTTKLPTPEEPKPKKTIIVKRKVKKMVKRKKGTKKAAAAAEAIASK